MEGMNTAIHRAGRTFGRTFACLLLCSSLIGCELIADFDRSKIPSNDVPTIDAGDLDASTDAALDAEVADDGGSDIDDSGQAGGDDAGDDDSDGG
jgi:hypothetical protein